MNTSGSYPGSMPPTCTPGGGTNPPKNLIKCTGTKALPDLTRVLGMLDKSTITLTLTRDEEGAAIVHLTGYPSQLAKTAPVVELNKKITASLEQTSSSDLLTAQVLFKQLIPFARVGARSGRTLIAHTFGGLALCVLDSFEKQVGKFYIEWYLDAAAGSVVNITLRGFGFEWEATLSQAKDAEPSLCEPFDSLDLKTKLENKITEERYGFGEEFRDTYDEEDEELPPAEKEAQAQGGRVDSVLGSPPAEEQQPDSKSYVEQEIIHQDSPVKPTVEHVEPAKEQTGPPEEEDPLNSVATDGYDAAMYQQWIEEDAGWMQAILNGNQESEAIDDPEKAMDELINGSPAQSASPPVQQAFNTNLKSSSYGYANNPTTYGLEYSNGSVGSSSAAGYKRQRSDDTEAYLRATQDGGRGVKAARTSWYQPPSLGSYVSTYTPHTSATVSQVGTSTAAYVPKPFPSEIIDLSDDDDEVNGTGAVPSAGVKDAQLQQPSASSVSSAPSAGLPALSPVNRKRKADDEGGQEPKKLMTESRRSSAETIDLTDDDEDTSVKAEVKAEPAKSNSTTPPTNRPVELRPPYAQCQVTIKWYDDDGQQVHRGSVALTKDKKTLNFWKDGAEEGEPSIPITTGTIKNVSHALVNTSILLDSGDDGPILTLDFPSQAMWLPVHEMFYTKLSQLANDGKGSLDLQKERAKKAARTRINETPYSVTFIRNQWNEYGDDDWKGIKKSDLKTWTRWADEVYPDAPFRGLSNSTKTDVQMRVIEWLKENPREGLAPGAQIPRPDWPLFYGGTLMGYYYTDRQAEEAREKKMLEDAAAKFRRQRRQ